jgi:hypothetical protein
MKFFFGGCAIENQDLSTILFLFENPTVAGQDLFQDLLLFEDLSLGTTAGNSFQADRKGCVDEHKEVRTGKILT